MFEIISNRLNAIFEFADGIVCVSRVVADEIFNYMNKIKVKKLGHFYIGHFHNGADILASNPINGTTLEFEKILVSIKTRPTFLMVSTVGIEKVMRKICLLLKNYGKMVLM